MNLHITIPCHENWDKMLPREQGRHCEVCCKTVVDFTQMQPAEITDYMQKNVAQKICGRFTQSQLSQTPKAGFYQLAYSVIDANFFSYARKWMAIVALCFIFSQNAEAQTKPRPQKPDTTYTKNKPLILGKIAAPSKTVKGKPVLNKPSKKVKKKVCEPPKKENEMLGELVVAGMVIRN